MQTLITIVHVFVSFFLILSILLQSGKGGGMGALGGGGGAQQVFGGRGAGNFLSKMTSACAIIFMITSLSLSTFSSHQDSVVREAKGDSPTEAVVEPGAEEAAPEAAAPEAAPEAAAPEATPEAAPEPAAE